MNRDVIIACDFADRASTLAFLDRFTAVSYTHLLSMGRATPFAGERVTGKCKFTIAGGKIAWLSSSTEN